MTEQNLIKECRKGDKSAFKELYDLLSPSMMLICRRYMGNSPFLKDVFQEAFVKIYNGLESFEYRGEGSLKAWASRIVVNTSIKALRKADWNMVPLDQITDLPEEEEAGLKEVPDEKLLEFIMELPAGYRTVVNLYAFEHKTHAEISEMLGISPMTSASQLSRARVLLTKRIKRYESENDR